MNEFILYLLKSTICISLLYLVFRSLMRKESFFALNRMLLIGIVLFSLTVPLVPMPQIVRKAAPIQFIPAFAIKETTLQELPQSATTEQVDAVLPAQEARETTVFPIRQLIQYAYLTGWIITLLILIRGFVSIFLLSRKARMFRMENFRLLIVDKEIPAFSFGRLVVISGDDYRDHQHAMLAHEQAHIRLNHFFDLILLEAVKIFHWFNPVVYLLIRDMKEIHEFQADEYTLTKGIDAAKYQLLIIQKGVGSQRFALANSFNYCQIKNRIAMMNKQKTSTALSWKVATFLPMLALLLMAFGRKGENVPERINLSEKVISPSVIMQQQNELTNQIIEIKKDGNYIDNKLCSLQEIVKKSTEWYKASNKWILLLVDESIPLSRIDEVRGTLKNYFVVQSTVNSTDLIFFAGDVNESAKFSQGKFNNWLSSQLKKYPEIKSLGKESIETIPSKNNHPELKAKVHYHALSFSFIVGKDGKVRDAHIVRGSGYREIDAAWEKILSQIPDWLPAKRGGENVSTYHSIDSGNSISDVVVKK